MGEDWILTVGSEAIKTTLLLATPLLGAAMLVGLIVSIFQAVTQINEATLTFIPKMVAVVVVLVFMAPWMIQVLQNYTLEVLGSIPEMIR